MYIEIQELKSMQKLLNSDTFELVFDPNIASYEAIKAFDKDRTLLWQVNLNDDLKSFFAVEWSDKIKCVECFKNTQDGSRPTTILFVYKGNGGQKAVNLFFEELARKGELVDGIHNPFQYKIDLRRLPK